jgi:acetoacetyl-CoA synthetase
MMWNFVLGGLLAGAAIVLYDGQPDPERLWQFGAEAGVTTFGTSAGFIAASMKAGVKPPPIPSLESIGSTGSPLSPEAFEWIYEQFPDVWLFSTSGGTDMCTAFVGACPLLPVYAGELQARCLGAAVESWSEDGRPLVDEVGELVITEPMPSMPIYFWNDSDGERYRSSYFDMFPGVWRHGDWIKITERGTAVIYGRSDSTINRGGVRMGTSEIYSAVEAVPEVLDSLVVDVEDEMILFVVPREGGLTDEVAAEIRRRVREHCSPRHVPDRIVQIPEVPRTLSNKKLEVPVKKILLGAAPESTASRDSLANPDALDWIAEFSVRAG